MKIITGQFKGRTLLGPKGRDTTRPITAAVKKSLFGILGESVRDTTVVDLFCGTGSLGLEALSAGAKFCYFADRDRLALLRLRRNIEALALDQRCAVWTGDVTVALAARLGRIGREVDLAFVDPPYAQSRQWSWPRAEQLIFQPLARHLSKDGTVVLRVEASVEVPQVIAGLSIRRLKRYGQMAVVLLTASRQEGE